MRPFLSYLLLLFGLFFFPSGLCRAQDGGFISLSLSNGKVNARIPLDLMGKRIYLASVIEQTSDAGEGVSGQMSDNCLPLEFAFDGSELTIRYLVKPSLVDLSGEIPSAIGKSSLVPDWKQFKASLSSDKSAVEADLTELFADHFNILHVFPVSAYNSQGGMVMRKHTVVREKSSVLAVENRENSAEVVSDMFFKMDGYVYGMMKVAGDFSVRAIVRKMLFAATEESCGEMLESVPEIEDLTLSSNVLQDSFSPVLEKRYACRHSLDSTGHLVFHIDVPSVWEPYVREGVLVWNTAFEKAGRGDVLQVRDAGEAENLSPYDSRIIYAPTGMQEVETNSLRDPFSGEMFSTTICLHENALQKYVSQLRFQTAATNPAVRVPQVADSVAGSVLKLLVMQAVGKSLGLVRNPAASSSYPVDSLCSVSFTRNYGIVSSVMENPVFNFVASSEDVARGVLLVQNRPGPLDEVSIAWLYGDESVRKKALERLRNDEYLRPKAPSLKSGTLPDGLSSPYSANRDLGDDAFLSFEKYSVNQKAFFPQAVDLFSGNDPDLSLTAETLKGIADEYATKVVHLCSFAGGCQTVDGTVLPLPASLQRKGVRKTIEALRDMDWFRFPKERLLPYGTVEFIADVYRTNIFNTLLGRYEKVQLCASLDCQSQDSPVSGNLFPTGYSTKDFVTDIYLGIFPERLPPGGLESYRMNWQLAFVEFLAGKSASDSCCRETLLRIRNNAIAMKCRPGTDSANHYAYLRFITDKALNIENN